MDLIRYESDDPDYGTIKIEDKFLGNEHVRFLTVNGAIETAAYLHPGREYELFSDYLQGFNWAYRIRPDLQKTLLIGGGGFAYPKYYISNYPDKRIDVVEISPMMVRLAHDFFGVDQLIETYDLEATQRMRVFIEDGMRYLKDTDDRYDVILNDAYIGKVFHRGLQSNEGIALSKQHLSDDGIYVMNLVTADKGIWAYSGRRMMRKLLKQFRYAVLLQANEEISPYDRQNCLIFASDRELFTRK